MTSYKYINNFNIQEFNSDLIPIIIPKPPPILRVRTITNPVLVIVRGLRFLCTTENVLKKMSVKRIFVYKQISLCLVYILRALNLVLINVSDLSSSRLNVIAKSGNYRLKLIYMKKLFLTVAILLGCNMLSMAQNYQTTDSKVSWNVKAGMNISNWTGDGSDGSKAKVGFKVGAGMEYALDNTWSLQPSLFLTSKGAKGGDGDTKATINQVYLELPVNLQARVPVADKTNILFAAGPYFAYGVGGKISGGASIDGVDYSVSTNTFGKNRFKRFDAGLGLGVSLEMSKVIVGLEGQLGLTKIGDGIMSDGSPKNINFGVTVGYKF